MSVSPISSAPVLVGYATRYGSTKEVAEAVVATLRECGLTVDARPLRELRSLEGCGAVVVGAPLFMFHWHKDALNFLARHRQALTQRPVAVFALGPTHEPHDDEEWRTSRSHLDRELANFPWLAPIAITMFGGKFDPTQLRFPLNRLAGTAPATDIRDWTAIRTWARDLATKLGAAG